MAEIIVEAIIIINNNNQTLLNSTQLTELFCDTSHSEQPAAEKRYPFVVTVNEGGE